MADKTKVYQIKVPIYTSNNIPNEHKLFGDTYVEMLESAKLSIEKYNNDPQWPSSQVHILLELILMKTFTLFLLPILKKHNHYYQLRKSSKLQAGVESNS